MNVNNGKFRGIFVTADDPKFLEKQVAPERELLDLGSLNVADIRAQRIERQKNYDTTPFDPEGRVLRLFPGGYTVWSGYPGAGKCLGKGTPVMLFDGSIKSVEEVAAGDLLMGPDSKPRRVLATGRGREMMYRVTPVKGDSYTCNESHILSLRMSGGYYRSEPFNISIREYLSASQTLRERAKGWRAAVDWPRRDVPLDPYFLGVWLGDGSIDSAIVYKPDEQVLAACEVVAEEFGLRPVRFISNTCKAVRMSGIKGAANPIYERLRALGVTETRNIPLLYRANSRVVRLQVLAGLLDTDGSLSHNGFDFISKTHRLANDVAFVARSVGLAAYISECVKSCQTGSVGTFWRVSISGDCSIIPTRIGRKQSSTRKQCKRVGVTGITVEPIGDGEYFGFELDGDGLFLLGDFTVTHNTTLLRQLACHLMHKGSGVFVAGLEESTIDVFDRHACVALGTDDPTQAGYEWCVFHWGEKLRLWACEDLPAPHQRMLAAIRVLARQGVRHAVIDSLMCLDIHSGDWEAQRQFANALKRSVKATGVHVHLVAHPRKIISSDQSPDINDVAGSADIGRLADNVIFVRRVKDESIMNQPAVTPMRISVLKQRHFNGAIGEMTGWFHRTTRQFKADQFDMSRIAYLPAQAYQDADGELPFGDEPRAAP